MGWSRASTRIRNAMLAMVSLAVVPLFGAAIPISRLPHVELHQVGSVRLPSGQPIIDGRLGISGEVVVWSKTTLWWIASPQSAPVAICAGVLDGIRLAVFDDTAAALVVVESTGTVSRVPLHRPCGRSRIGKVVVDEAILAAGGGGVAAVILNHGHPPRVMPQSQGGQTRLVLGPGRHVRRLGAPVDYGARLEVNRLLLTETTFPFRSWAISQQGDSHLVLDPSSMFGAADRAKMLNGWTSGHAVLLDSVYLQVLADPRSDERRLVTFSATTGKALRSLRLDVAAGIIDAVSGIQTAIAIRNTGQLELVYYRWRWRRDNDSHGDGK